MNENIESLPQNTLMEKEVGGKEKGKETAANVTQSLLLYGCCDCWEK